MPLIAYSGLGTPGRKVKGYEIYTIEEAERRHIKWLEPLDWRERFFDNFEDLTGQYILTNDAPSLVAPVVHCLILKRMRNGRTVTFCKLSVPWTAITSKKKNLFYAVKASITNASLWHIIKNVTFLERKLFLLLMAMNVHPNKAVYAIFGVKHEIEQNYIRRKLMSDPATAEAASVLARDIFKNAGYPPEKIAEEFMKFLVDPETPAGVRKDGFVDVLDRTGVDDRAPEKTTVAGFMIGGNQMGQLGSGEIHRGTQKELDTAIRQLPQANAEIAERVGHVVKKPSEEAVET